MKKLLFGMVLAGIFAAASSASAAPITFFGQDLNGSDTVRLASHPNADAA